MLSAFTARPIIELRQRDKSKIETILAYGDRVLVALNSGSLRIYRLNEISPRQSQLPETDGANTADSPGGSTKPDAQPTGPKPTDLLREVEKFSTRSIEQLAIIKEANTLISLSNYHVSIHDLGTYELTETLTRTKNATSFAVTSNIVKDAATNIPEIISRLAVAVKRKLLLWSWHAGELHDDVTEILLPEAIRTVVWANATKLVCGLNAGYVLVDVTTAETKEITGASAAVGGGQGSRFGAASMGYMGLGGYVPKPLAARLTDDHMLLARDINTLFIDVSADGRPLEKRQIPWQAAPEGIGYSYPYILALQNPAKGSLEVRNPDTLSLLQAIELPGAANMHFPPPTVSLVHAAKGFHVSSDRAVWKMDATDYDTQVQELIDQGKFDEAISVLNMLEDALLKDKHSTLREVKMRKAEALFRQRKFRHSLDLFNEDDVHAPPERVLKLYPRIIAGDLSEQPERKETSEEEDNDEEEPKTKATADKPAKDASTVNATGESASPARASAFARYWIGGRKTDPDAASIASSRKGSTDNDDAASVKAKKKKKKKAKKSKILEGDELKKAVRELNSYLAGTRARLQRVIDPTTGKLKQRKQQPTLDATQASNLMDDSHAIAHLLNEPQSESDEQLEKQLVETFTLVDTTLFRGYMFSQPSLIGSLLRIANFCDPDVVKEKLLEKNRFNEIVDFFHGKRLHREALEILRRFGEAEEKKEKANANADSPGPTTENEKSGQEAEESTEAVINEKAAYADADADADADGGDGGGENSDAKLHKPKKVHEVQVDVEQIPEQLRGPRRTVAYLQSLPPDLIDLVLEFARWVLIRDPELGMQVFVADTENAETLPRDRVLDYLGRIDVELEVRYLDHVIDEWGDGTPEYHNRFVELLVGLLRDDAEAGGIGGGGGGASVNSMGGRVRGRGTAVWNDWMAKLVRFLRESRQISLSRAYALIPRDDPAFFEALAVVYSSMGQHKQALEIYVFKMQDYVKAEDYCNRIYRSGDPSVSPPVSRSGGGGGGSESATGAGADPDDPDDTATPSIYHTLLSLYLTPPPPHKPNLEPALSLLSRHGSRLPAASTLSLIPDDLPVADLTSYFRGRIRAANSAIAQSRIVEGLRRTQLVNSQSLLLLGDGVPGGQGGRNRRVVISEERICGVCHKRLGNSVIAVRPDNTVVHYGCQGRDSGRNASSGSGGATSGSQLFGQGRIAGSWGRLGSVN